MPDSKFSYVVGGGELGRAPALKKCPCCGGIADYTKIHEGVNRYRATCSACGMETALYAWPQNAGEAWNVRASEGPRVVTLEEIQSFKGDWTDGKGRTACWLETIEGELLAMTLAVSMSMEGLEVYECDFGDYWPRDKVEAEGIRWRLWDKRPIKADRIREPWGRVGYQAMSDAARREAERIQRELDERRAAEARAQAMAARRRCVFCADCQVARTEDGDIRPLQPFECARDGHAMEDAAGHCEHWRDMEDAGT